VLHSGTHRGWRSLLSGLIEFIVLENLVILLVIAACLGGFSLVLFSRLQRHQRRAPWKREAGIRDSQRLERRAFIIGVAVVLALMAALIAFQMLRQPGCVGRVVIVPGPDGTVVECVCEGGRRGVCFDPGP
jgi:hypothetical protein